MKSREDLSGKKFTRLTVLDFYGVVKRKQMWNCICECGNRTIVNASKLRNGNTKSCGCYAKDMIGKLNLKTGKSRTKLYYTYRNMLNRCYRENNYEFDLYGGRGIKVYKEWLGSNGFCNFYNWSIQNGYKENLSIDRIDVNADYCPTNCRWVDKYMQANNKRNNHYIKINGVIDTVGNMARKYNISYWNLLHYSKGGKNCMYPGLNIEVVNDFKTKICDCAEE